MRVQFTQPASLDGKQLQAELAAAKIVSDLPNIDHENNFWLNIDEKDIEKATSIVDAHIAIIEPNDANKL